MESAAREEREALLAQDEFLRQRGALMAAVECEIATVRAWDGRPDIAKGAYALSGVPLAGFSIIEAESISEAARLVADTPCARAKGAIEIRPVLKINDTDWKRRAE